MESARDSEHATPHGNRLRLLVDAGIALSSELSLDALLQRIVETAAELTGARYAALGVVDKTGQSLERFLTTGIDAETYASIGELPRGRGILGVLIRDARPLRLRDLADDPRSVGFPRNHPPMRTFLGVPIVLRGVAFGNLYLTEKSGGAEFTADDEELTQLLAAQAAVAIENARLYASSSRWLRQLETLNEIGAPSRPRSSWSLSSGSSRGACRSWSRPASSSSPCRTPGRRAPGRPPPPAAKRLVGIGAGAEHDEDRARPGARPHGTGGRCPRRSRGRSAHRAGPRRDLRDLPATLRAGPAVRGRRGSRQARTRPALRRGRRPAWPSRSCRARQSRSTSPSGSAATPCAASWRLRSSSVRGSRASCTTRRARRLRRSSSGLASSRRLGRDGRGAQGRRRRPARPRRRDAPGRPPPRRRAPAERARRLRARTRGRATRGNRLGAIGADRRRRGEPRRGAPPHPRPRPSSTGSCRSR